MAKFESYLQGNFDEIAGAVHDGIMRGSASASYEDGSDFAGPDFRCAVRVYERYSMIGQNRVSLNVTLVEGGGRLFLSAITSGGSQAVLFKINTLGEQSFLDRLIDVVRYYQ